MRQDLSARGSFPPSLNICKLLSYTHEIDTLLRLPLAVPLTVRGKPRDRTKLDRLSRRTTIQPRFRFQASSKSFRQGYLRLLFVASHDQGSLSL